MKPVIIENSRIPKYLSWFIDVWAITLYPFIICKGKLSDKCKTHESIHIYQQTELYIIFFYIVYIFDFAIALFKYKNFEAAYHMIRFEQEAYEHEDDDDYLKNRERFAWKNQTI